MLRINVGSRERWARVAGGLLMVMCGLSAFRGSPAGYVLIGLGAASVVSGIVRYCPACAVAGRKPNQ